jgi:predicted MFS family arabinose efflux permease
MAFLNILGLIATLLFLKEMPRKIAAREHSSYMAPLKSRIMRGIFIYRMTAGIGTASLMAFVPLYAELKLGLSTTLIGIVLATRTPASIVQSYTGSLADRWNRRSMVFWGGMATVVTTILLPQTGRFWTLLIVYVLITLGQSFGIPAANAYIVDEGRTYGMGTSMTMFMLAMQIGNGIGPVVLGGVSDRLGLNAVFYSASIVMASGIAVCDWILRRSCVTNGAQGNS